MLKKLILASLLTLTVSASATAFASGNDAIEWEKPAHPSILVNIHGEGTAVPNKDVTKGLEKAVIRINQENNDKNITIVKDKDILKEFDKHATDYVLDIKAETLYQTKDFLPDSDAKTVATSTVDITTTPDGVQTTSLQGTAQATSMKNNDKKTIEDSIYKAIQEIFNQVKEFRQNANNGEEG